MGQADTKRYVMTLEDMEELFAPCDAVDGNCAICAEHDRCWGK